MRALWIAVAIWIAATGAFGQGFPKAEIFAGYSYANLPVLNNRSNANGWSASATVNIYRWFGLTSDLGGLYGAKGTAVVNLGTITETEQLTENFHTFMFGPQVSFRKARFVPFAHFLVGEARVGETLKIGSSSIAGFTLGSPLSQRATSTGIAAFGLGLDYALNKNLAWRVQGDSLLLAGSSSTARLSTGIVFRVGK